MSKEKISTGRISIARSISLTPTEWSELDKMAQEWRMNRSSAFRRIWLEWQQQQGQAAGAGQADQGGQG